MLPLHFYQQPAETLARALLGCILIRKHRGQTFQVRIVETEAYIGSHDLACHASKGRTQRTEPMFSPGGCTYVYLIYGLHHMLNVVASIADDPQAVLMRGAINLNNLSEDLIGPGKLTRFLNITRDDNHILLDSENLHFIADASYTPTIERTKRIGVDYARVWKDKLLRFIDTHYVKK
ncbi:MAG TPA: DNA-3-methyladenine glycosylase [Gemmatales bacterium]|nr:DNA-3-methyladenine glycosylase [Gemmatales bacterium]HMP16193.1 DNA-3-methyladenine glycosylase [Gemmatales bacterium]